MVSLAASRSNGPVGVERMATEEGITANYIHVLMGNLKAAGLVRSVRGPNGGYELARKPETITAFDVVSVLEGDLLPAECLAKASSCDHAGTCSTQEVWREVACSVEEALKRHTLQELAERQQKTSDVLDYNI